MTQPSLSHSLSIAAVAQLCEMVPVGHLLERTKIELQDNPGLRSTREAVRRMWARGGVAELAKGAEWNVLAGVSKGIARWGSYVGFYRLYGNLLPAKIQKQYPSLVAGCVGVSSAAMITTFVACPLENLKIGAMTAAPGTGVYEAMRREGVPFFFKGWFRTVLKQSGSLSAYLVAYEKLKQRVQVHNGKEPLSSNQKIGVSAAAGMVSCLFHTPLDMLKTKAQSARPLAERGLLAAVKLIHKEHGIAGFYRSLPVKLFRSGWHAAITLGAMDRFGALPAQMKA